MTKKDYELIAACILQEMQYAKALDQREQSVLILLAKRMAKQFGAANVRFNPDRFLEACGVGE